MAKKETKVEEIKVLRGPSGRFLPSKSASKKKSTTKIDPKKRALAQGRRRGKASVELAAKSKAAYESARSAKDKDVKSVERLRAAALQIRSRAKVGGLSKKAQELAKAHGIMRVNPSSQPISAQLKALSMDLLIGGSSAWVVSKVGCMGRESFAKSESPFVQRYGVTLATGGATAAAYLAARMVAPKYSAAILMGGTAATVVHALVAMRNEDGVSVGRRLFPQALQGYVTIPGAPQGKPSLGRIPSVEDFANPTAMEVLEEVNSGSLSGSIFD